VADTILLVFEGERTEPAIFDNIQEVFFRRNPLRRVYAYFGTNIRQLWRELKDDPFFDTVPKLRELAKNKDDLQGLNAKNVAEIHLFFDFEGHLPEEPNLNRHCDMVNEMLNFFSNEHEHGKLWISYPMVEALKHAYGDPARCFEDCVMKIADNTGYKEKIGGIGSYQDARKYTYPDWRYLLAVNIHRASCLVTSAYELPGYSKAVTLMDQQGIFHYQKDRFILPRASVAVLSAFPFFLVFYFGEKQYQEILQAGLEKPCRFRCLADAG
jgi:hypothetical protein